ncbi:MAG: putative toxin-antitoxin system toxin component, PIN family [Thermodesulfobacteriota bacterium]
MKILIDTNVLFTGLKSRKGASFKLLSLIPSNRFSIAISVPLLLEYEEVLNRGGLTLSKKDITDIIDFFCSIGEPQKIFFLWRPFLPDPSDDLVLELAVASGCKAIITYNKRHFKNAEQFGLRILDPREFLTEIGEIK